MSSREIRIATRKSALALWQAEYVKARLEHAHPGLLVTLVPMVSRGDSVSVINVPFSTERAEVIADIPFYSQPWFWDAQAGAGLAGRIDG